MNTDYNLELEKTAEIIKSKKAKKVLIQLPDGLKPLAVDIADFLEKKTKAEIMIWFGSCYGACDVPEITKEDADLIIQFGHSEWKFKSVQ